MSKNQRSKENGKDLGKRNRSLKGKQKENKTKNQKTTKGNQPFLLGTR
jgi:hypothetical protein